MATFITLFVAIQLFVGIRTLLTVVRQAQANAENNARFQPVRVRSEIRSD